MFKFSTTVSTLFMLLFSFLKLDGAPMPEKAELDIIPLLSSWSAGDTQQQVKSIPQGNTGVVIIKCKGDCKINNFASGELEISATLTSSGSIWGWKSINTPPLQIITEKHGDTLYITTTPFNLVYTFGISTYNESMLLDISLPATVKMVLVDCKKKLSLAVNKTAIASMSFKAHDEFKLEGSIKKYSDSKDFEFEFAGTGSQNFILQAAKIHAKLQ